MPERSPGGTTIDVAADLDLTCLVCAATFSPPGAESFAFNSSTQRGCAAGRVTIGALPALLGDDLASGFTTHFGSQVVFEAQDAEDFGRPIIPMFGEPGARPVIDSYVWRQSRPWEILDEDVSAQKVLGLTPRTVAQRLEDLAV